MKNSLDSADIFFQRTAFGFILQSSIRRGWGMKGRRYEDDHTERDRKE